jgi:hypothetical protein
VSLGRVGYDVHNVANPPGSDFVSHFLTDGSTMKVRFLGLNLVQIERRIPPRKWAIVKAKFAITFEGRFSLA